MRLMLRHKALLPVAALAVMSAIYVSFSLYALFTQQRGGTELAERVYEIQGLSDLILQSQDLTRPLVGHVSRQHAGARVEFRQIIARIENTVRALRGNEAVTSEENDLLEDLPVQLAEVRRLGEQVLALGPAARDQQLRLLEQLTTNHLHALHQRLLDWHHDEVRQATEIRVAMQQRIQTLYVIAGALVLLAVALIVAAIWYYERVLVAPLLDISRATTVLASGNLQHRLSVSSRDEIGQLAGNINRMAGALDALTERLSQAADTDALTGLLNRRAFGMIIEREAMLDQPCGLAILDLDHFKRINDTHGHAAGDAVLRHVATLCQRSIRGGDFCFRYGGEEFIVFMPGAGIDQARLVMERCRTVIEGTPLAFDGKTLRLTASYGLAASPADGQTRESLVQHADDALYAAKEAGRNRGMAYGEMGRAG